MIIKNLRSSITKSLKRIRPLFICIICYLVINIIIIIFKLIQSHTFKSLKNVLRLFEQIIFINAMIDVY